MVAFSPPTHEEPMQTRARPLNYYRLTESASIMRIAGILTSIRHPRSDLLAAAGVEGVDWFLGGREYDVTPNTATELEAGGFFIYPGYGVGAYGFGPYGT